MTTYLQIVSTSGRRWLDRITLRPGDFAIVRTRSSISVRPRGSRPVVGSSKMYSSGSWTIAWASLTFCFMPVEYSATLRYRSSSTPTNWRTSCERLIAVSRPSPLTRPMYVTSPTPVMSGMRQSCSGMYPIRSRTGTPSAISCPRTFAVPVVGRTSPRRRRKKVVFPAPFGPTRPIAPSGIATLRSSTARTSPNTFVSPAVSMSTVVPSPCPLDLRRLRCARWRFWDSFLSAFPINQDEDNPHRRGRDQEQPIDETEGRPFGAVRVGLQPHLCHMGPIRVRVALHIISGLIREVGGLVGSARNAADPGKTPDRLIQLVRGEGPHLDRDVLPRQDLATPDGGDIGPILRTLRTASSCERGIHDQVRLKRRASILADLELECRDRGHGGACCYPHRRRERRRESEHHVGRVRGGRVRLNREVRPVLPDLRCASCERTRHVGGSHIRDREGAGQEAGRVRVDRDDRDWNASGED